MTYGLQGDIDAKTAFRGKRVVIVGNGAFAVENARTALMHGASRVTLVCRRAFYTWPRIVHYLASLGGLNHIVGEALEHDRHEDHKANHDEEHEHDDEDETTVAVDSAGTRAELLDLTCGEETKRDDKLKDNRTHGMEEHDVVRPCHVLRWGDEVAREAYARDADTLVAEG